MPTLPWLVPPVAIWEFTPITWPAASSSGPPELPGLIGASVWITESIWKPSGAWMCRPVPDTIPAVAVCGRPNGEPIATASWPVRTVSESASSSAVRPDSPVDPHDREVGRAVDAAHRPGRRAVVGELDLDAVAVPDDVRVGDDRPVGVDDEPGAGAGAGADRDHRGAGGAVDRGDVALLPRARRAALDGAGGGGARRVAVDHAEPERAAGDERGGDEPAGERGREAAAASGGRRLAGRSGRGRRRTVRRRAAGSGTRTRRPSVGSPWSQRSGSVMPRAWAAPRQLRISAGRRLSRA